jgi:hypothetical protein
MIFARETADIRYLHISALCVKLSLWLATAFGRRTWRPL